MSTLKSPLITRFDAVPRDLSDVGVSGARERAAGEPFEVATGDLDINDIIHLVVLPANARIKRISFKNDQLDSGGALTADVGIYTKKGVVKDVDVFASAITDFQSANVVWKDVETEALDIASQSKKLFELAGDADDTEGEYFISITFPAGAATAVAGTLSPSVEYLID